MGEHHGCWPSTDAKFPLSLADIQRRIVIGVCLEQGWNRAKASLELEVSTRTLDHWLDRYRKDGAPIPPGRGFRWRKGKSA